MCCVREYGFDFYPFTKIVMIGHEVTIFVQNKKPYCIISNVNEHKNAASQFFIRLFTTKYTLSP